MLTLLPVFLYIAAAIVIVTIFRSRTGLGYSWLVALGVSIVIWLIILAFRWMTPAPFILESWHPLSSVKASLVFKIDDYSWPYAMSLASLAAAVILTAPSRLQYQRAAYSWVGSLAVTGAGILAVLANTPWTLVLAWTAIDLIEVLLIIGSADPSHFSLRMIVSFATRVAGTVLVLWSMGLSLSQGNELTFDNVTPQVGLGLLLAVTLRLGLVPLHLPFVRDMTDRRGLGTILRLVVPASSLVLLGRLSNLTMPYQWAVLLSIITAIAALYGGVMWLAEKDELNGRPYWLIALAGMAVASVVRGNAAASIAWGVCMILSGGLLFLFSSRSPRLLILLLLGVLGFSGLPFTPAAGGWSGLIVLPFTLLDILFIISHILLLGGYFRHALRTNPPGETLETWIRSIYPVGLLVIVLSLWIVGATHWQTLLPSTWWGSVISTVITLGMVVLFYRLQRNSMLQGKQFGWLSKLVERLFTLYAGFFRMDWLYDFLTYVYRLIQSWIDFITGVMEGEGGILWSLLLLVLLFSLWNQGIRP